MSESIDWDDADGIRAPTRSPLDRIRHLLRRRTGAPMPEPEPNVRRFRRRPIEVEAVQVRGSDDGRLAKAAAHWCRGDVIGTYDDPIVIVGTPHGPARARSGDWILREPAAVGYTHRVVWGSTLRADHEEADPT
ncbi:hypothetical protein [Embleya sp. NPDC001921]